MSESRPKMKTVYPWVSSAGQITIHKVGSVLELPDPDGSVTRLLSRCDGSHTVQELASVMGSNSGWDLAQTSGAITALDQAGLLEDGTGQGPERDQEYDGLRWSRDLGLLEAYSDLSTNRFRMHANFRSTKVALLGLGGVGSRVFMDLMGSGIRDVRVLDFDTVDLTNLNRQVLYRYADIGRKKTERALEWASEFWPEAKVQACDRRLGSVDDVYQVVHDRDVVISAVDTPKMSVGRWVNEACVRARVPFITGGVQVTRSFIYTIVPGQTGCVECWRMSSVTPDDERVHQQVDQADQEARAAHRRFGNDMAAFGPLVSQHAGCIATEFARIATGIAPPSAGGQLIAIDMSELRTSVAEEWERQPTCPTCGHLA